MPFKIAGLDGFKKALKAASRAAAESRQAALLKAAEEVAAAARANAPKDTGELAGDIRVMPSGKTRAKIVVANDHAGALEYGTGEQKAQPFLRPAVDQVGPGAILNAARSVAGVVERAYGG